MVPGATAVRMKYDIRLFAIRRDVDSPKMQDGDATNLVTWATDKRLADNLYPI